MKKILRLLFLVLAAGVSANIHAALQPGAYCENLVFPSQNPPWFPTLSMLPMDTKFAAGPLAIQTVLGPIAGLPTNSHTAILNGMHAWNAPDVNTRGRLAGWSGVITASDCPLGQPFQIGLMNFFLLPEGGSCWTVLANRLSTEDTNPVMVALAFSDYDPTLCTGCGTKSIVINTAVVWSTDGAGLPGQRDLQSVMAHEFGHVLGMGHHKSSGSMQFPDCYSAQSPTCVQNPNRSTMENINYAVSEPINSTTPNKYETCGRDLGELDKAFANQLYPAP